MSVPRLLLLSGTTPGESDGGAIVLRDLCRLYPHDRIVSFSYQSPSTIPSPDLDFLRMEFAHSKPLPNFRTIPAHFRGLVRWLYFEYRHAIWEKQLRRQIVAFGRENAVEKLLTVMDDPMIIATARHVARELGVPLIGLVWDDPQFHHHQVGTFAVRHVCKDFELALRASRRVAVVSKEMQETYEAHYQIDTVVLCHGIDDSKRYPAATQMVTDDQFIIGLGGNLYYGKEQWYALLRALDLAEWRIGSRAVKIRYLGRFMYSGQASTPQNIEFLGFRPWHEVISLLANTDVLYLPMPPHTTLMPLAKLSFPSKMITYLATGRPIFYHGTPDGTAARLMREYGPGLSCYTSDTQDIITTLTRFIEAPDSYYQMAQAAENVMEQEFSQRVFRQRFAQLLDLSEDNLL